MGQSKSKAGINLLVSVISIFLGFIVGAILMLISGVNPFTGFSYLFQGGLSTITRFCNTLGYAVPLMLTGLSVAFSFKTGLFNIGAPGQMLMGGLFASVLALTLDLPRPLMLCVMVLAAIIGGMVWAGVPGFLKAQFNVNEVVSCIMMNWIAYWIVYITITTNFRSATISTDSQAIPASASLKIQALTQLTKGSNLNLSIVIALLATALMVFILNRTTLGYEMKAVGYNRFAAEYGGISVRKNAVLAMMFSGALAGLAGLSYYCGYLSNMRIGSMPSQGFDGIAVALLANCSPVGVVFAAIFFAVLQTGKGYMNAMLPIPPEIADIIIAAVIYFAATSKLIHIGITKLKKRRQLKKENGGAPPTVSKDPKAIPIVPSPTAERSDK